VGNVIAEQYKVYVGGLYGNSPLSPRTAETLRSKILEYGFRVVELDQQPDLYVAYDLNPKELKDVEGIGLPKERRVLIRNEPEVVWPINFSRRNVSRFGLVISLGRSKAFDENADNWPQFWVQTPPRISEKERLKHSVIMCGNKISLVRGELYSLRRLVLAKSTSLDLFGFGWDYSTRKKLRILFSTLKILLKAGRTPHFFGIGSWFHPTHMSKGAPSDKLATLAKYRTTIVIENSREYITEKLFDAFFARTIPIYVGPALDDFMIPNHLVISVEPTVGALLAGMKQSELLDYDEWRENLDNWLKQDEVKLNWNQENVYLRVLNRILAQMLI